jgi:hypothetical protein
MLSLEPYVAVRRLALLAVLTMSASTGHAETPGDTRMLVSTSCAAGTCTEITLLFTFQVIDGLGQWTLTDVGRRHYPDPKYTREN